jgi:hypothetical protein
MPDTSKSSTCTAKKTFMVVEAEIDVECGRIPHEKDESHQAKHTDPSGGRVWFIWDEE